MRVALPAPARGPRHAQARHSRPEFEAFRAEAKELATALGPARDSDALRELIETGPVAHFGAGKDFAPLLAALEERRAAAYADARALLEMAAPTLFALRLSAFVARRGWRNALGGAGTDRPHRTRGRVRGAGAGPASKACAETWPEELVTLPYEQRHKCGSR